MSLRSSARQSSAPETAASVGVLLVLVVTAAWFWTTQSHFSPAVTVAATAAKAAERSGSVPSATAAANAQKRAAADLMSPLPAGLKAMSPAEAFTPDTLSDKIDGKAELYLSAGFAGMRCQRVAPAANPGAWFEAFIYDMAKPENAFAVYSSQKRTATTDAGVGDYGYRAGNQLCIVHGQYYLEFVGADDSVATLETATALAKEFVANTKIAQHANVAKDEALFPTENMIPGSVMLLSADVFGFDQLTNTYVARYREGSDTVALFLCRRPSAADATKLAGAVRGFFVDDCGGKEVPKPAGPANAVIVDGGGTFDGVFASGPLVAGVRQAPNRESAERLMQQLNARLAAAAR